MMNSFNIKTFLASMIMASSNFASSVPQAEEDQGRLVSFQAPMCASNFDALPEEVMGYIASFMPIHPFERAQDLVTVCKYFHSHFVPHMWFSWMPLFRTIPAGAKLVQRVAMLNLAVNDIFQDADFQRFTNLTCLDLTENHNVTDESVKNLIKLTRLCLGFNKTVTDGALEHLTNLIDLDLCCNATVTNQAVKNLTNLRKLSLRFNTTVTGEALKDLTKLRHLVLSFNDTITPAGYAHLPNVRTTDY